MYEHNEVPANLPHPCVVSLPGRNRAFNDCDIAVLPKVGRSQQRRVKNLLVVGRHNETNRSIIAAPAETFLQLR
jgi:hypothetical protein